MMKQLKTTQLPQQPKLSEKMIGRCSHCGVNIIELKQTKKKRITSDYCEHLLELSNKTLMRVAVCPNCKVLLVSGDKVLKTADKIIKNHIDYWNHHQRQAPGDYKELYVVDPNTSKSKFFRKREKAIQEEEIKKLIKIDELGK